MVGVKKTGRIAAKKPRATRAKRPRGRPSVRSPQVENEMFERMSRGEPLAQICRDDHMPHFSTVWRWEEADETFRKLVARGRENGTHFLADDCIRIADDPLLEPNDKRVRVDTRLKLIGMWNVARYGPKLDVNANVKTESTVRLPEEVTSLLVDKLIGAAEKLKPTEGKGKAK